MIIINSEKIRTVPNDFRTHLNYVKFLREKSSNITLTCKRKALKNFAKKPVELEKNIRSVKVTKESIDKEYEMIKMHSNYARYCVSWIAVKSYYLLYYLELILIYLIDGDKNHFEMGHSAILKIFKNKIAEGILFFNKQIFNEVKPCYDANKFRAPSGSNLRSNCPEGIRTNQILRKLAEYKGDEFKRDKKIRDYRKESKRKKRDDFLKKEKVTLFDFFYLYRIKSNYRDLKFIDQPIPQESFQDYYEEYYNLTMNFYSAFEEAINNLATIF